MLAWALVSCEDKIDLDLPEGERFTVVQGWISNEPGPHLFRVNFTQPYFDSSPPPPVTGAIVTLRDDQGMETVLTEVQPGTFAYPDAGVLGRSYSLRVVLPDGTAFESDFETLSEPVPIDAIRWGISSRGPSALLDQTPDQIYEVVIDTQDPAGVGDFYRWKLIVNGIERSRPVDLTIASDEFVDGNPIVNFEPFFELFLLGDTVTIVQERITREAYEFLLLIQSQTAFVGGPFDTPPAPIRGNVRNLSDPLRPAMGFVGAAARSRATVVVGN